MATIYETVVERCARLAAEKQQRELEKSSQRQAEQLERANKESGARNGARQLLENLIETEREAVRLCRAADTPANEAKLAEIQAELVAQAKVVSKFDPGFVKNLGLEVD